MPTKKVTLTLDIELVKALKKEAKRRQRSMAGLINRLLTLTLEKSKDE